jgi:hypothetical protein
VENVENTTDNNYYASDAARTPAAAGDDAASGHDLADLSDIDLGDSGGFDDSTA